MSGIFISYRREDSGPYAGRLRDALSNHFGSDQVFRDLDRINPGERFAQVIERAVGSCDVLLAVIGPTWLSVTNEHGELRINDPGDHLRREIVAALKRDDVLLIPVLIESVTMPHADDLPEQLVALAEHNALRVSNEGWDDQVARLIRTLEPLVHRSPEPEAARPPAPRLPPRPVTPPWPAAQEGSPSWRASAEEPPSWQPSAPEPAWQPSAPRYEPPVRTSRSEPSGSPYTPTPSGSSTRVAAIAVGAIIAVAVLALAATQLFSGGGSEPRVTDGQTPSLEDLQSILRPGEVSVLLSPTSGPPGASVTVSGTGFGKDETVDIMFHATEVGSVRADSNGSFTAEVTIPDTPFRDQQFDISGIGKQTFRSDSAPFMVE